MTRKLMNLCELQLCSILQEIDASTVGTTGSAVQAMEHCQRLSETLAEYDRKDVAAETLDELRRELGSMMVSLQFHDELAQRIHHVLQVFELLKQQLPACIYSGLNTDAELLDTVSRIFSVRSEFALLPQLFPNYHAAAAEVDLELF